MIHIVQYSGGISSFLTGELVLRKFASQEDEVIFLFADTLIEDGDLYRFNEDVEKYLDIKITRIADGRTPWEVFKDVNYLGNSRVDPCSKILKRDLCKKWVRDRYKPNDCIMYVGINWMEQHRVKNVKGFWAPYEVLTPLVDLDNVNWAEERLKNLGIKRPRLYDMGFPHNNCGGFCVKAGKAHFANLLEKMPERFWYHAKKEKELQSHLGKPYTILREQIKGEKKYISLEELGNRILKDKGLQEEEKYDWGGCGCFSDIQEEEFEYVGNS